MGTVVAANPMLPGRMDTPGKLLGANETGFHSWPFLSQMEERCTHAWGLSISIILLPVTECHSVESEVPSHCFDSHAN